MHVDVTAKARRQVSSGLCVFVRRRVCRRAGVRGLFQQPLGVQVCLLPLETDRGLSPFTWGSNQGAVYKLLLLLLDSSSQGHWDTQRPSRVFSSAQRNPQACLHAQSQSHTPTHVNTHIQPLTHRPTYVPNFLQSYYQTCSQFSVRDRGPWEAVSELKAR